MANADPRRIAFQVLLAVETGDAFADAQLGDILDRRAALSDPDRRLATRLVYGTLAWRGLLDHTIAAYSSRSKIDRPVAIALRLGILQLRVLDRIPAHAAVDTTVRLVREVAPHAAGFTNAMLRRVARDGLAPPPVQEPQRTAVSLSHPTWLVELWTRELGDDDAHRLMRANNEAAPNVVRALKDAGDVARTLAQEGINVCRAHRAPRALVCDRPLASAGLCIPQSEASQLVCIFANVERGAHVLDTCAAPGGKTAYLAELVGPQGRVVAIDSARDAAERIGATLALCGVENVDVQAIALEEVQALGHFDLVLVDAPCSGLGTLREHPEIRWRRTPNDLARFAERQRALLAHAAAHVHPGGVLVYATCTIARAENEQVIDAFLREHDEFAVEPPSPCPPALSGLIDDDGYLRTYPHRDDTAGFFAARLRRRA